VVSGTTTNNASIDELRSLDCASSPTENDKPRSKVPFDPEFPPVRESPDTSSRMSRETRPREALEALAAKVLRQLAKRRDGCIGGEEPRARRSRRPQKAASRSSPRNDLKSLF